MVGAAGFVGRPVVRHLVSAGHAVVATHRPGPIPAPIPGARWVAADLTAPDGLAGCPARCESVVFLAQSAAWRDFPASAGDVVAVNVAGALRVAEHARVAGARRLLFASSGSVYDGSGGAARETDTVDVGAPRSFYAASKLAAELLLGPYRRDLAVLTLRLFVPYGAGQRPPRLMPELLRRVRAGEPIQLDGTDGLRANPVFVADVAEAVVRSLRLDRSVTLNVAGPEVLTLRGIAGCLGRAVGRPPHFDVRPERTAAVVAGDTAALRATTGWAPATGLEAGVRAWLEDEATPGGRAEAP